MAGGEYSILFEDEYNEIYSEALRVIDIAMRELLPWCSSFCQIKDQINLYDFIVQSFQ